MLKKGRFSESIVHTILTSYLQERKLKRKEKQTLTSNRNRHRQVHQKDVQVMAGQTHV